MRNEIQQVSPEGDEWIIEPFLEYLRQNFRLDFGCKVPLKELGLISPKSSELSRFYSNPNSHVDITVRRHGKPKPVCCIEVDGWLHASHEKQKIRDRKKLKYLILGHWSFPLQAYPFQEGLKEYSRMNERRDGKKVSVSNSKPISPLKVFSVFP